MTDREFILQRFKNEQPLFEKVLRAVPENNLDYRPHQRSRSGGELVAHLLGHIIDLHEMLDAGVINHRVHEPYSSLGEAVQRYSNEYLRLVNRLNNINSDEWYSTEIKMNLYGNVIMEGTISDFVLTFLLDSIHHRGQLISYIRPMGGKVPGTYGPSLDEIEERQKSMAEA